MWHPPRPAHLVAVIDCSGSMAEGDLAPTRLAAVQQALQAVLTTLDGAPVQIGIAGFAEEGWVAAPLTDVQNGRSDLHRAIGSLRAGGGTHYRAGLRSALEILSGPAPPGGLWGQLLGWACTRIDFAASGPAEIIFLSDGWNRGWSPLGLADALKRRGVVLSTVGVGGSPAAVDQELLKRMASRLDGESRYRFITNLADLTAHYRHIARDLMRRQEGTA